MSSIFNGVWHALVICALTFAIWGLWSVLSVMTWPASVWNMLLGVFIAACIQRATTSIINSWSPRRNI